MPIPEELKADCTVPEIPDYLTWGDSLILNATLLSELGKCNQDKAGILEIEKNRASL